MLSYVRYAAVAPLWGIQLLTRAKSFESNAIIGSPKLNEWGLHARRVALAYRVATARRERLARLLAPADRTALDRDGYVVKRDFLPPETFGALCSEILNYKGPVRQKTEGATILREIAVTGKILKILPTLDLARSLHDWQSLIRYAGARDAEPEMIVQSVTQHAAIGDHPHAIMHADTFHPTAKAWLSLTDAAPDSTFTYVPGSHRLTPERLAWEAEMSVKARDSDDHETRQGSFRVEDADLARLRLPGPVAIAVPKNTLLVADTFGFYARGVSAGHSHRVEVLGIAPRSPFLPWTGLDTVLSSADTYLGAARMQTGSEWETVSGISMFETAAALV